AFASIYYKGARLQVERYREIFSLYGIGGAEGASRCLHEFSNLLEDLNTLSYYMKGCGYSNKNHKLYGEIRDHVRHSIREHFGKESTKAEKRSLAYLKIQSSLQEDIKFDLNKIKVGETVLSVNQIEEYLDWTENIITGVFNEAEKRGYLKRS
ncbi:MAG: hypothetical protein PHX48_04970, partial [Bacteroidales bacterium]|nr:hypothetical protein [Bacteroidales bacterium]